MKKLILLLALFSFIVQLNAQEYGIEDIGKSMNKLGVKLGVNFANFSSNPTDPKYSNSTKFPYIGMISKTNISEVFILQTEFGYNILGTNYDLYESAAPVDISLGYITIGAIMKAYLLRNIGFNVGLGLQYGYLIYGHQDDLDIMNYYKSSDFDLAAGVGYDFDFGMLVELRYLLGLTNVSNLQDIRYGSIIKNRAIQLQLGWMF